ncbi:MAG TPA: carboxypeptidase-like regulatory domain-containing protein, partial [Gemmatimonadaceae bacterium]
MYKSIRMLFLAVTYPVLTQAQTAAVATGTVGGIAIDSIRGGYLKNATITITGSELRVKTDTLGRFMFTSLPEGRYSFRLSHPLLDTVGIGVLTQPLRVNHADTTRLILSVPSPATVARRRCSNTERAIGEAALVGTVTYADSDLPAPSAEVVVAWTDFAVASKSVNKTAQRRFGRTHSDGTYIVCGIPADLQTGIIAYSGADSTAEIPVTFANGLVIQSFHIPSAVSSELSDTAGGSRVAIFGKITDEKGAAIEGARVAIDADNAATTSDSNGEFRLTGVRSGTRSISVRKIGYAASDAIVDLSSQRPNEANIKLSAVTQMLPTVNVSAIRDVGLQRVGFTERKRTATGTFF